MTKISSPEVRFPPFCLVFLVGPGGGPKKWFLGGPRRSQRGPETVLRRSRGGPKRNLDLEPVPKGVPRPSPGSPESKSNRPEEEIFVRGGSETDPEGSEGVQK
jgi:hypothetical protein